MVQISTIAIVQQHDMSATGQTAPKRQRKLWFQPGGDQRAGGSVIPSARWCCRFLAGCDAFAQLARSRLGQHCGSAGHPAAMLPFQWASPELTARQLAAVDNMHVFGL